jgi:hypothetical protein
MRLIVLLHALSTASRLGRTCALYLMLAVAVALGTSCGSMQRALPAENGEMGLPAEAEADEAADDVPDGARQPEDDAGAGDDEVGDGDETGLPSTGSRRFLVSMVGDATFTQERLGAAERRWYDRTWQAIEATNDELLAQIGRDNSYDYGRTVFQYHHALLLALRATGDLRFLDAVDVAAQAMRNQLRDRWCDGVAAEVFVNEEYGTVKERDGHLNFRFRRDGGVHYCRDTSDLHETLAHGYLALLMYAYHVNRDNPSPGGIDYAERADFWLDYLRNHFEPKWRERSGAAWPDMDFIGLKFCHTYMVFNLYYYFVGKRLESDGDPDADAYLRHANVLTDAMFDQPYVPGVNPGGFVDVVGPSGDAVIYSFGAPRRGSSNPNPTHLEACPTTYARYAVSAMLILHLEGHPRWDDAIMTKLANGLSGFVLDKSAVRDRDDCVAPGVSGSDTVAGMPPTSYRGRLGVNHYGHTTLPALAVWDASGRIERISQEVYGVRERDAEAPQFAHIPASMLFVEAATRERIGLTALR